MNKVCSVGCVGFLVEGTTACVLVDEVVSCLSGGQDHLWCCVLVCCDLVMILGSQSANGWWCVPVLLVASWSLSGAGC